MGTACTGTPQTPAMALNTVSNNFELKVPMMFSSMRLYEKKESVKRYKRNNNSSILLPDIHTHTHKYIFKVKENINCSK